MNGAAAAWWTGTVGYEIYIRSFADSTGDGTGDLVGIEAHLDHLAWLGVDSLWITPFYPTPGFDHGYDVSDYRDIDPVHGDLAAFDRMTERAHDLGLRVIVDLVPNHTSSHHRWFVDALQGPSSPTRDYYVWRNPAPDGGPPNNWVSHFGGPAWTLDEASGQYYCHLFLPEQPDLNWANPAVADEFDDILRFWCERGADGFRIDVAHGLTMDAELRDNPQLRAIEPTMGPRTVFGSFEHRYDLDQPGTLDVYRRWRRVVEPYNAMLLGEVGVDDPHRQARYSRDDDGLHTIFWLRIASLAWEPDAIIELLVTMHDACPNGIAWAIDSHDQSRSVSRYGGGEAGRRRSLAMFTMCCALGGTPFLFQGQELGLANGDVESADLADPISTRNPGTSEGRDGCRTAMPWEGGPGNGFTTAPSAWLPAADRPLADTVEHQRADPSSSVHRHRELLVRRRENPELWLEPLEWIESGHARVLIARRGPCLVVANFDHEPQRIDVGSDHRLVFESDEAVFGADSLMQPDSAVILRR